MRGDEPPARTRRRQFTLEEATGTSFSLTRTVLDHLLDLLLYRLEVERSRILHRRVFDCSLRQLSDVLLYLDEAPELPGKEVIAIPEGTGISRLAANSGRALERILPDVDLSRACRS